MRKILIAMFSIFVFLSVPSINDAAAPIKVYIDGQPIKLSNEPVMVSGTVMVPFRTIFEKLGLTITWDQRSQTITGKKDGLDIQLIIGQSQARVNGQYRNLSVVPMVIRGNTLVPLRFIGEATGNDVTWKKADHAVSITSPSLYLEGRPSEIKMFPGLITQLKPVSGKIDLQRVKIIWTSSNDMVATVNSEGLVTAIANGSTKITGTVSEGNSVSCTIRVTNLQASDVRISKSSVSIEAGESEQMKVVLNEKENQSVDAIGYKVLWTTDDNKIATVEEGLITGVSAGSTVIQAFIGNQIVLKSNLIVREAKVISVELSDSIIEMNAGATRQLLATVNPSHVKNSKIIWRSDNSEVALVDGNGIISAVSPGKATITATAEGTKLSDQLTINVKEKLITLQDVINEGSIQLFEAFLNQNYISLPSALGDWNPRFQVTGSPGYKVYIRIDWMGPAPLTLDQDYPDLEIVQYGRVITSEEKLQTKNKLRDFQMQIATMAEQVFPSAPIYGEFYSGFYKYPYLRVGYNYIKFLGWSNFDKDTQAKTNFHWDPTDNNFNFVIDQPIRKVSYYDESTGTTYENGSVMGKLSLKVGESKTLNLVIDPEGNNRLGLDYGQMGLKFYSSGSIISVDSKGMVTGLRKGTQSIMVSYHWNAYVTQYISVNIE
ncbi:Ig-like domain-containing protein [Paenibacillus luteus]|uniref:Ig-like domain-containing protein n=1 Tax=Paenibacillus luteus TaxID=2545753 RepID=UPI001142EF7C|nr:Ig-like domain-containing protein [Paenibacillus luteus]